MDQVAPEGKSKRGKKVELICDCGCGTNFYRYRNKVHHKSNYLNRQHLGSFNQRQYLQEQCGPYLSLLTEYLEGSAKRRYRKVNAIGHFIGPFFRYLCERSIHSVREVVPSTITAFQLWARDHGYVTASKDISALSVFFQWAIVEGHYSGESPVIPAVHGKRKKARSGRPYSEQEMTSIRRVLEEQGNERLRAFFEIASESGLRRSEVCRLRVDDISLDTQRINVRLPNKGMRERTAFFSERAASKIREWLAVRKMDCGHELLFHNSRGGPLSGSSILAEFQRSVCETYEGGMANKTGLETFSLHRLRHTLTSNLASAGADATTLMTSLGWVSLSSVDGYSRLSEQTKVHGFVRAMDKVERQAGDGFVKQFLTPEEFLSSISEETTSQRCV